MIQRIGLFALIGLVFCMFGCDRGKQNSNQNKGGTSANKKLVIAVIPKSVEHIFWKTVEAGARQGERETGCEIRWQGPNTEADRATEKRIMEDMIQQADAICVAPSDANALVDVISDAHKKMPVIIFDSGANTEDYTAFIATDNRRGGEIAGEYMLKLVGDAGGKVAVMRGVAGSQSTTEREEGFISAVKKNPKVQVIDVRGENETAQSQRAAADVLQKDPDIVGFFGCSEPATKGVMLALEDAQKAGKIKFVGFDGGSDLAAGMDQKVIDALVVQRPVLMGEMAVKAAVAACKGEKIEKIQKIEPQLITQQNKDQPDIRELLVPRVK